MRVVARERGLGVSRRRWLKLSPLWAGSFAERYEGHTMHPVVSELEVTREFLQQLRSDGSFDDDDARDAEEACASSVAAVARARSASTVARSCCT